MRLWTLPFGRNRLSQDALAHTNPHDHGAWDIEVSNNLGLIAQTASLSLHEEHPDLMSGCLQERLTPLLGQGSGITYPGQSPLDGGPGAPQGRGFF